MRMRRGNGEPNKMSTTPLTDLGVAFARDGNALAQLAEEGNRRLGAGDQSSLL